MHCQQLGPNEFSFLITVIFQLERRGDYIENTMLLILSHACLPFFMLYDVVEIRLKDCSLLSSISDEDDVGQTHQHFRLQFVELHLQRGRCLSNPSALPPIHVYFDFHVDDASVVAFDGSNINSNMYSGVRPCDCLFCFEMVALNATCAMLLRFKRKT